MSFGIGGGSTKNTSTSTTPLTATATSLLPTLSSGIKNIAGGQDMSKIISDLTTSTNLQTKAGIANIREAFGASGLSYSTDIARSIGDFQSKQTAGLNAAIDTASENNIQDQLASLAEIIQMFSGSGTTVGKGSQFGWNLAMKFLGKS